MAESGGYEWRISAATVRGASHKRNGKPNQDAVDGNVYCPAICGLRTVVAVADGHSDAKCTRSHIGAALAVRCAIETVEKLFASGAEGIGLNKRSLERAIPGALVSSWRAAVFEHVQREPPSAEELELLANAGKTKPAFAGAVGGALREGEDHFYLLYGATAIVVIVTDNAVLYMQIGDGDILAVSSAGEVEAPIADDPALIANETPSLCLPNPVAYFRFGYHHIGPDKDPPALILASTDGYKNAFEDVAGFHKVGQDILQLARCDGLPVPTDMETWLNRASEDGSGDDVTLAILCRGDILGRNSAARSIATPVKSEDRHE